MTSLFRILSDHVAGVSTDRRPAAPAEARSAVRFNRPAVRAGPSLFRPGGLAQFHGEDAGGHGDNAVAQDHDHAGENAAQHGVRGNVAVTNGRERDDRPVDAARDAVEPILLAFDQIHDCAYNEDDREDGEDEDRDLAPAGAKRGHERLALLREMRELEDAEDTKEPQNANHQEVIRGGDEESYVAGQKRDKVDDSVEAPDVTQRTLDAKQTCDVLESEKDREGPLGIVQENGMRGPDGLYAFEHYDSDAQPDRDQQTNVEYFSAARAALEDDQVEAKLPRRLVAGRAIFGKGHWEELKSVGSETALAGERQ